MQTRIGISGWRYRPWKNDFYPSKLKEKDELNFVSKNLNSVELKSSFYSLRTPKNYENWYESTEKNFIFSVMGNRYITHLKRLKNVNRPLANFFASGVLALKEKLGPFLWQLPKDLKYDHTLVENFLKLLPQDTLDATILARKHDRSIPFRAKLSVKENFKLRHAIEVKDESFFNDEFYTLLKKYNISLVMSDSLGRWPLIEKLTSDFVYIRLYGNKSIKTSRYSEQNLDVWMSKINEYEALGLDVYAYFDNEKKIYAPFNAMSLLTRVTGFKVPDFTLKEIQNH